MEFRYEKNDQEVIEHNVPRERIGFILNQMDDLTRTYCGLTVNDDLYIQCAGSYAEMIVEMRVPHEEGFRHYAIGHIANPGDAVNEKFEAGMVEELFYSFSETQDIPPRFVKRDMTDFFK